jgi:BAI1-associated protein 3
MLFFLRTHQEEYLAEAFNMFLDHSLQLLRKHRQLFPPNNRVAMCRLEYLLRYSTSVNDSVLFTTLALVYLRTSKTL